MPCNFLFVVDKLASFEVSSKLRVARKKRHVHKYSSTSSGLSKVLSYVIITGFNKSSLSLIKFVSLKVQSMQTASANSTKSRSFSLILSSISSRRINLDVL